MKKLFIILSLLLFLYSGMQAQSFSKYNSANVSLQYPSNWRSMEHKSTKFMFLRPLEEIGQAFRENINLVEGKSKGLSLVEYVGASKVQLEKMLSGYKVVSTKYLTLNNRRYCKITYAHMSNGLFIKADTYVTIVNNVAYQFTCSSLQTTYDRFKPVFDKMMASCKIKG